MGQAQSCTKSPLDDVIIHHEDEGEGSASFSGADDAIITQVARRHKEEKNPRRRELMVAGLQVRQQRGESIGYLLKSLPYGSIIQLEVNTHLFVAQAVRKLHLSIYQNLRGNIQMASIESQEGICPATLKAGQILVTINGKTVKTVDQAVQLLSMPEKLLIVVADAPLDKRQRQQRKGTTRMVDCHLLNRNNSFKQRNALDMTPTSPAVTTNDDPVPVPFQHESPNQRRMAEPAVLLPQYPDHLNPDDTTTKKKEDYDKNLMPLSPRTNVTLDTVNTSQYDEVDDEDDMIFPRISSPSSSVASPPHFGAVSRIGSYDEEENGQPYVFSMASSDSQDDDEQKPRASSMMPALNKLDSFLDDTMMELAYVMIEMEELSSNQQKDGIVSQDQEKLEKMEHNLRHKIFKILERKQRAVKEDDNTMSLLQLPTIEEQPTQVQHDLLQQQVTELREENAALKKELLRKDAEIQIFQRKEQQHDEVSKLRCQ